MTHPTKHAPHRYVASAADHLGFAERLLRTARKSGAKGEAHLWRLEEGVRDLRRLAREVEKA